VYNYRLSFIAFCRRSPFLWPLSAPLCRVIKLLFPLLTSASSLMFNLKIFYHSFSYWSWVMLGPCTCEYTCRRTTPAGFCVVYLTTASITGAYSVELLKIWWIGNNAEDVVVTDPTPVRHFHGGTEKKYVKLQISSLRDALLLYVCQFLII
jgi:hypothetical protein